MNPTVTLVFTIAGAVLVLLTVYGAIKLDRKLFLSGLCFFSLLPIIGETMAYNTDKAPVHIVVIFVFIIQLILALPNKIVYGQDNIAANQLVSKIALSILIINVVGAVFVLYLSPQVPAQFGYFHIAFSLAIIYVLLKRTTSGAWVK
jgi:hypothetical protein